MAKIKFLTPIVIKWESRKFTDDPIDRGGATKIGVTLSTWKAQGYDKDGDGDIDVDDLKLIADADYEYILKTRWDRWKADWIINQSIANILVDWVWGSGKWGIVIPQRILDVYDDGIVGNLTLNALNNTNQLNFFNLVKSARLQFLNNIVAHHPEQQRFINGWINRLNDFTFKN